MNSRYQPYTNNLLKRFEMGAPFLIISILILGVAFHTSYVLLPEYIDEEETAGGILISIFGYLLLIMVYW